MQILKDEIKEQIENAAINVFLEKGYEKASMQAIAEGANISTSNIYNYYESKEKLFSAIVDPVYRQINHLLQEFMAHETDHSFQDVEFVEGFIQNIATGIGKLIKEKKSQVLLVFDKSRGTQYVDIKENFIKILEDHFRDSYNDQRLTESASFTIHIGATNLVEGLLEIVRHYRNNSSVEHAIRDFVRYHIRGLAQFFD